MIPQWAIYVALGWAIAVLIALVRIGQDVADIKEHLTNLQGDDDDPETDALLREIGEK